jgi:uncharacterized protein YbjT (DUF2867 family)
MAKSILVIGGTGKQGGAVASELLRRGHQVSVLTRDPTHQAAKKLSALGAVIQTGNLDDIGGLVSMMQAVDGVFLNLPPLGDEVLYGTNAIEAAKKAGVSHLVYSSVARAGDHESFPGWNENYPLRDYWINKALIQDSVRSSGLEKWTILQPAFYMQNFCRPDCEWMFPGLAEKRELAVAYNPDTRLDLISYVDIGKFAAEAFESPAEYTGKTIALATESLTASEIAKVLSNEEHGEVQVKYLTDDEAQELVRQKRPAILSQLWNKNVGYSVDLEKLKPYNVSCMSFAELVSRGELGW